MFLSSKKLMLINKTYHMNFTILLHSMLVLTSCGTSSKEVNKSSNLNEKTVIETEVKEVQKETQDEIHIIETETKKVQNDISNDTTTISEVKKTTPEPIKASIKKKEVAKTKDVVVIEKVSHKAWDVLLKKYVDKKGNVDYKSFKKEEATLQIYLEYLATNKPNNSSSKNEKLAYYINLYNAATVKLILDNYPTKSIKSIKSPWGKKWVKVGDELLSLGNIEHKILRKMNEPRIHFAINCASYSCPKLINAAFTADNMEQELEQATIDFVNDTTRNKFDQKAELSEIFKWYKSDFTTNGTVLEYIAKYKKINTKSRIGYLDYDWSLNEAK